MTKTQSFIINLLILLFIALIILEFIQKYSEVQATKDEWASTQEAMKKKGYKKISTYGDAKFDTRIGNRIYPDAYVCHDPRTLIFVDREGLEVDFIDSHTAWCKR